MIPRAIKICGTKWRVRYRDNLLGEAEAFGLMSASTQEIVIQTALPIAMERATLLHEILHILWRLAALRDPERQERSVEALSALLAGVLRENRALRDYL